ncbi:F-box-like domain superfamily [Sesbania bispinosa]|nr:F-box-like domain superfamily [Sesbania bispinosa]
MVNEGNSEEIDRISELPDEVLCHILSFLPSKEAIATSTLSTKWKSLWTMVPVLDFEHFIRDVSITKVNFPFTPEVIALADKFSSTVNKFLSLRKTESITRFRIKCRLYPCNSTDVSNWVSAAIAGKVEHLSISLLMRHQKLPYLQNSQICFSPPNALFNCSTIVSLNLEGCFLLRVPSSVHLPCLKNLRLHVGMVFNYDISRFLSGCPALEMFYVKRKYCCEMLCKWLRMVQNSQVNQLVINERSLDIAIQGERCYEYVQDYLNGRLQNLVKANVYVTVHENKAIDIYPHMEVDPYATDVPEFHNLIQLEIYLRDRDSIFLKQIPENCPHLEALSITVRKVCEFHITDGLWDILPARRATEDGLKVVCL